MVAITLCAAITTKSREALATAGEHASSNPTCQQASHRVSDAQAIVKKVAEQECNQILEQHVKELTHPPRTPLVLEGDTVSWVDLC